MSFKNVGNKVDKNRDNLLYNNNISNYSSAMVCKESIYTQFNKNRHHKKTHRIIDHKLSSQVSNSSYEHIYEITPRQTIS